MATGFQPTEYELGRLVMKAVRLGTPEAAFGLGGMRTVGPAVTMGMLGYTVNGERGILLGRTFREARHKVCEIYAAHRSPATVEG